jgi:16S rRNA (cytidine1402-2'-O)-methyltransferase
MATLFVVSTPIGNLGDITYRAIEVLRSVPHILAEDTRRTRILLQRYGIETRAVSAHAHNEEARAGQVKGWLEAGEDVAMVSDAGTPLLSDPGARLVGAVLAAGHTVAPIPGASALLAALVASGLAAEPFSFYGFTPRSGGARTDVLQRAAASTVTTVFYEAPSRLTRLLADLETLCGGDRRVAVARELTKVHESFFRGTLSQARVYYGDTRVRGEVVVILAGVGKERAPADGTEVAQAVRELVAGGWKPSAAAREVAKRFGLARSEAYRLALDDAAREEE